MTDPDPNATTYKGSLTAGAGRAEVELPSALLPVEGFASVHDPLSVRVLVLDDGATRAALVVVDQTSVFDEQVDRVRRIVGAACAVDATDCLVVASHTFSAPHVFPPGRAATPPEEERAALLAAAVDDAVARAAAGAAASMRPALVGFRRGTCRVNVQRDVRTPHGWWVGADDEGDTDDGVGVLRIDASDGRPIAVLVNYAVQSSVMNGALTRAGERQVSADLAGAAVRRIEERCAEGTVALFLIGAAGDQAPYLTAVRARVDEDGRVRHTDAHDDAHVLVGLLGERLGDAALRAAGNIRTAPLTAPLRVVHDLVEVPGQKPPAGLHALRPSTRYVFEPDGTTEAPVVALRVGDTVFAGVQAELNARTGLAVKAASPWPDTCVVTMVNGAAKYMADAGSYDRMTYEAMNSRYARGAAETVAARIVAVLRGLGAPGRAGRTAGPNDL
ncbi:hypothetical protein [Streptomyces sp. NPDC005423]|uniref:hypothetical protein n=1 Tax=Streptomyces sp. NPDC005423 TaxID=3155343 RepID=UPI0033BDFC9D